MTQDRDELISIINAVLPLGLPKYREELAQRLLSRERSIREETNQKWIDEISKAMPSDYKDWFENSKEELPLVARLTIENLRKRESLLLEQMS